MLFDIFSKTKKENSGEKEPKPEILCDVHEKNSLVIAELSSLGAEIEIKSLEIGDYIIGNIAVERKTINDFASSMINRRLLEQLNNMIQYEKRILILEGEIKNARINENAIRGMILSTALDFKTPVIQTKDEYETAKFLILLAKQQMKQKSESSLHSKKPDSKEKQIKYILESFPGIGPVNAETLLEKFSTIRNIINAGDSELKDVLGKKADSIINLRDVNPN